MACLKTTEWRGIGLAYLNQHAGEVRMRTLKKAARLFHWSKGQTMAEYALLLASVAIIVFAGYQKMGSTITTTLSAVDGKL